MEMKPRMIAQDTGLIEKYIKYYDSLPILFYHWEEFESFYQWVKDQTPETKKAWGEMIFKRQRKEYEQKGIPKNQWPPELREWAKEQQA